MIKKEIIEVWICCLAILWVACGEQKSQTQQIVERDFVVLDEEYPEETEALTLSQLADMVFHVKLHHKGFDGNEQLFYSDSLILVHTYSHVYGFDHIGKLLYQIQTHGSGFDVLPEKRRFYTYGIMDGIIREYDFQGKEIETIRLRNKIDTYGNTFLALSDTLFVLSQLNTGNNPHELFFVGGKGQILKRMNNPELFQPLEKAYMHHSTWRHPLFKGTEGGRFYRCFGDTLWEVCNDMTLKPLLVERKISKLPMEQRTEYSGEPMNDFIMRTLKEKQYAVRHYDTSRFYMMEYKAGGHERGLSNFLIWDKNTCKLYRIAHGYLAEADRVHLGIFNDYDGGLAFAPTCQSGDYLIMIDAGKSSGGGKWDEPRALYREGNLFPQLDKTVKHLPYRSDVYQDETKRQRLNRFFQDFNDKEHTMLTIVKVKK